MEAYTSSRVSTQARKAWLEIRYDDPRATRFLPEAGVYRMFGWESEIGLAKAMGTGWRNADNLPPSKWDSSGVGAFHWEVQQRGA